MEKATGECVLFHSPVAFLVYPRSTKSQLLVFRLFF